MPAASPAPHYQDIAAELSSHGLALRGGFLPAAEDGVPDLDDGAPVASLLVVGNLGGAMWPHFAPYIDGKLHPLDRWTRAVLEPIAGRFGARAVFPFDTPPLPFQRWAKRAEGLHSSPVGVLIHPEFGLWHAYRAALLFAEPVAGLPAASASPAPCDSCARKPCLSACPVGAFTRQGYEVPACGAHLASPGSAACHEGGCRSRDACPVGREHRYPPEQVSFHMSAFARAIGPR